MIVAGDEDKAKEYRENYVHQLGNLTITGYNNKLGSKSFVEKRDRKDNKGRSVGYKIGLFLNATLRNKNIWRIEDTEERTKDLVDFALNLFKL